MLMNGYQPNVMFKNSLNSWESLASFLNEDIFWLLNNFSLCFQNIMDGAFLCCQCGNDFDKFNYQAKGFLISVAWLGLSQKICVCW